MKIDFTDLSYDAKWYDFKDGARLKIRPFPSSQANFLIKDGGVAFKGDDLLDMFKHCLVDWEGIVDGNGKPIKLTDDVKQKIFDFQLSGISDFVVQKAREFEAVKEDEEKN